MYLSIALDVALRESSFKITLRFFTFLGLEFEIPYWLIGSKTSLDTFLLGLRIRVMKGCF